MAPLIDAEMNELMVQHYRSDHDPKFLYRGSEDKIVKELQTWVVYRQKIYQKQREQREKIIKALLKMRIVETVERQDAALKKAVQHIDYYKLLSIEKKKDNARVTYLLESLKDRGVLWPKLWWRPDREGSVCSFLGTVDPTFDPDSTLSTLQELQSKHEFRAQLADVEARYGPGITGMIDQKQGNLQDPSAKAEKSAGEANAPSKKKATKMPSISALNTDPAKWAKIVRAIDSGSFPEFRIEEAKLVAVSKYGADAELRLDYLLEVVCKDRPSDWALKGSL